MSRSQDIARRALAIVPVAVVLATASASVAMAAPVARTPHAAAIALQTTTPACSNTRQVPGQTQGSVHCATSASGGTSPYSYRWTGLINNNRAFTSGFCAFGKDYTVSVTVTDATNTTVTKSSTNLCDPEGP